MEQRAPSKNALFSWSDGLQESPSTSYQICSRAAMFTQTMHRMGGASTPPPQGGARQVARKEPQQARRDAQKQAQPAAAAAQKKKTLALHRDPGFSNSRNSSQSNVNIGAVQEHNRGFTMASPGAHLPLGCCLNSWPSSPRIARVCPACELLDAPGQKPLFGRMHPCGQARKSRFQHEKSFCYILCT